MQYNKEIERHGIAGSRGVPLPGAGVRDGKGRFLPHLLFSGIYHVFTFMSRKSGEKRVKPLFRFQMNI